MRVEFLTTEVDFVFDQRQDGRSDRCLLVYYYWDVVELDSYWRGSFCPPYEAMPLPSETLIHVGVKVLTASRGWLSVNCPHGSVSLIREGTNLFLLEGGQRISLKVSAYTLAQILMNMEYL
ncbi:hypothetical protein TNCT_501581 [Trichonephila clavata]|uniref:Uncharacterized protein n=1 Tax=Trichonephila clavata TaxID=2740835 RepID=A0A8X6H0A2_TRICU|nr:hypothetical protein TNCT_501581 [Trichonephila clavata]